MMKRLTILIVILALGWSGYWAFGAWGLGRGFDQWFDARRAEGWAADYDDRTTRGFPNRFDTTFTNLALADPDTSLAWSMPFFQLFALSYRPHHVIAVWPREQTVSTPQEKLALASNDMRASLILKPGTALALDRTNLAIDGLRLTSSAGWALSASDLDLAMHAEESAGPRYRIALRAAEFAPPAASRLPSGMDLPRSFETFQADIRVTFDKPWDLTAIEDARPQPTVVDLNLAEITWGELQLNAAGRIEIDAFGYPTGAITIRAVNWREIIAVARASGHVAPGVLDTVESALELLSGLAGNTRQLDIPLTFKNGNTRLGPVPIAPAPIIRLQ